MHASFVDRLLVALQHIIPARPLGRLIYWLSRIEIVWFKNLFIRAFSAAYGVDTAEAAAPVPDGYASFNEFFTRELRSDARPLAAAADALLCPVDGTVAQVGQAENGQLIQAKGTYFSAAQLLGDAQLASALGNAAFTTIYLAPYNYHRIHMPCSARLVATHFIPGKLYSVNARTAAVVPGLYAVNERLVCEFSGERGRFALVLVGAMNVASMSTAWSGEIIADPSAGVVTTHYADARGPELTQGEYMGHFNMGSTIVLLGPVADFSWHDGFTAGATVRMGAPMAQLNNAP